MGGHPLGLAPGARSARGEAEWDEQHKPLRMIGVHVDVTDNIQHAKELERANLELQQMAHAASHDLLEPLRTISSFSQLVEREYQGQLDEEGRSWLEAIVQGTKRMRMLVEDLRAYTQLDARMNAFVATNMDEVLAGAIAGLQSAIEESGAEVTHDHLPSVMGDRSELTQLFQNLIGNAIKYRGEAAPRVHVSAKRDTDNYVFSVRDNGIGIAAEYWEKIFEVFRRLHHAQDYPGTGIGLAICRRVVQRHRGQIWVESEVACGSTFRFTIPIQQSEDPP